jgi:hypothetical protein
MREVSERSGVSIGTVLGVPELIPGLMAQAGEIPSGRKGGTMITFVICVSAVIALTVTVTIRIKRK